MLGMESDSIIETVPSTECDIICNIMSLASILVMQSRDIKILTGTFNVIKTRYLNTF